MFQKLRYTPLCFWIFLVWVPIIFTAITAVGWILIAIGGLSYGESWISLDIILGSVLVYLVGILLLFVQSYKRIKDRLNQVEMEFEEAEEEEHSRSSLRDSIS